MIHYDCTYCITEGLADLAMDHELGERLWGAVDDFDRGGLVQREVEEAITAKLREHGVTDQGEWLGEWSAEDIVRGILDRTGF